MINKRIRIGIIGSGGYTGGELIRILVNHPLVEIAFAHSQSQKGKPVWNTHLDLLGETDLIFTDQIETDIEVLFLCLGHGESKVFLEGYSFPDSLRIIDLSQDFRLNPWFGNREFIYGLTEINRDQIKTSKNIANPGCFATAIQLSLYPLLKESIELLSDINVFGTTGSTGAGRSPSETSHFSWRQNNLSIYKAFDHQHLKEIKRNLGQVRTGFQSSIQFIPQRGNFSRGIMVSCLVKVKEEIERIKEVFDQTYQNDEFIFRSDKNIDLKSVVNTNKVFISLEKNQEELLINLSLDNLIKGASGQAVQNMNLMMGIDETLSLRLKSIAY